MKGPKTYRGDEKQTIRVKTNIKGNGNNENDLTQEVQTSLIKKELLEVTGDSIKVPQSDVSGDR